MRALGIDWSALAHRGNGSRGRLTRCRVGARMRNMRAQSNGIEIEYETFGDPADPPLLLVMGLGCQLVWWNEDFVRAFVDRGFFVIIFDNRDVGLSTKIDTHIDLLAAVAGYLQGDDIEAAPRQFGDNPRANAFAATCDDDLPVRHRQTPVFVSR